MKPKSDNVRPWLAYLVDRVKRQRAEADAAELQLLETKESYGMSAAEEQLFAQIQTGKAVKP